MRRLSALFQQFNIRNRLVVYYLTFALLTLGAVVYFSYGRAVDSLQGTMEEKLGVIAGLQMNDLDRWVDEQKRNAVFLASLPELRSYCGILLNETSTTEDKNFSRQQLTNLLGIVVQRTADFQDIQVIDLDGNIAVSMIPANNGRSQADQPFFGEGTRKTFVQPFYESELLGGTALTVVTPLFGNNQKQVGVLVLHYNMRRVDEIFRQGMQEDIRSYLIGPSLNFLTGDPILLAQTQPPQSVGILSALNRQEGTDFYTSHDGTRVLGKYFWLEDYNSALVVEMDETSALLPARELAFNIAVTGGLISLVLVVVVFLIAERITAPLRALSEAVSRVSAGHMDVLAPVSSDDEVGAVARAFNAMTERLQQTLEGLQAELRERKQAEVELLQFRKVMDESSDAIYMIDPESGRYIDFNKSAYERLGYTRAELSQLGVIDIAEHVSNLQYWRKRVNLVRQSGELIFETVYRRKDGSTFPAEVSARMLDYGDQVILVASVRDISERKLAEAAVRESEERFRKVFQSSPVAICITTLEEGRLLDANYAYWQLTGYPSESSLGKDAVELKMWDVPEERAAFVRDLKLRRSHYNPDDFFYHTDGTLKQVISFYELIRIGQDDCILAMFYDMSAQKQTMQALQQSEARIRALLNAFPDMVMEVGSDARIIHMVPPKGAETLNLAEPFVGIEFTEVFPESVVPQARFAIQRVMETGQMNVFEFESVMAGVLRTMEVRLVASDSGTVLMVVRDITQRKWVDTEREKLIGELEAGSRESETLRESLASIVGTFEFSEIIQRILEQIKRVIPYDTASVWRVEGNEQLIISGVSLPAEIEIPGTSFPVTPENSAYPILSGAVPYILNNNVQEELPDFQMEPHTYVQSWLAIPLRSRGKVIGLIALDGKSRDQFTEHHARLAVTFANQVAVALDNARLFSDLQAELGIRQNLINELENKNAELERFTYTVSHDLKSPLFTIRGFLGYLGQDALSGNRERLNADIQRISDATDKMHRLLDELLELSRIGRIKNESVFVPFEEVAREAAELAAGQMMEGEITLKIQPDLPIVHGDRPRLVEVMQNLLDNASKFMGDQKHPCIDVGQAGEEKGMPILFVRDNGIGIAPEHFERVFGLFNKLDPRSEGTGIGLALVKRIIEVHGGRIWVESEIGTGTTFLFTLPTQPQVDSVL